MRDILLIQYETIPCWYDLSFDSNKPAIIVKIHKEFISHLPSLDNPPFVRNVIKEFGFPIFNWRFDYGHFGFEESFRRLQSTDEFIRYRVKIPFFEKTFLKTCHHCHGVKKGLFGTCLFCNGKGTKIEYKNCWHCKGSGTYMDEKCGFCNGRKIRVKTVLQWQKFYAIAASFSLFFEIISLGNDKGKKTTCKFPQLMIFNSYILRETSHSAPLYGAYSIPLIMWLRKFPENTNITEVKNAMKATWDKISRGFSDIDRINTWATVRKDGWLSLNCPGDRCCLYPEHVSQREEGYKFSCHNLDTPMQQLTFLAGLAALCDKFRKEN